MNLLTFWNCRSDNWDGDFEWWEWYGSNPIKRWWKRKIWSYTREFIHYADNNSRILHVGCGSSPCINFLPGKNYGIDINPNKIYFLNNVTKAQLIIGDIRDLNIDENFNFIIANEIFEYLDPKEVYPVIKKMASMLQIGGRLIVSFPDSDNWICRVVERILHRNERILHGSGEYNSLGFTILKRICDENNLEYISSRTILGIDSVFGFKRVW